MMTRDGGRNRGQIEFSSLNDLVPADHLGRPSLDPVILIKLAII